MWGAGEDTALAPLLPDLLAVLQGGGEVAAERIAAVGGRYMQEMRGRLPPEREGARWIVDKMLRNAWWVGGWVGRWVGWWVGGSVGGRVGGRAGRWVGGWVG